MLNEKQKNVKLKINIGAEKKDNLEELFDFEGFKKFSCLQKMLN